MAEERIDIPVSPKIIEPKDGKARRGSTGRTITSTSDEKILPHYLRASTGSCHDFCKHGRDHAFKSKEERPVRKVIKVALDECRKSVETVTPPKRIKKPVVKIIPSSDLKVQVSDTPKTIKREPQLVNQKASPSAKGKDGTKAAVTLKQKPVSPAKKLDVIAKAASVRPKPTAVMPPSSPLSPSRVLTARKNSNIKTTENNGVSKLGPKKAPVLPKVSLSTKPSVNRVASLNARKYRNLKGSSPLKNQSKARNSKRNLSDDANVIEKTIYVVESKSEDKSLGCTVDGTCSSVSSPSSPCPPPLSPSSSMNEDDHTDWEEADSVSEYEEVENKKGTEMSNMGNKRMPRRVATNHPEEQEQAWKLTFRRGTVINPQSEYNTPRRLRFRQVRVLSDNGRSSFRRRSFKKRDGGDGDTAAVKHESRKVVLRHQDVNGKKDVQGLFNNVIEETASKLVETRKSKVKALVGAFETVISLQESRSSPTSSFH